MSYRRIYFPSINTLNFSLFKIYYSTEKCSSLGRVFDTKKDDILYEKWVKDGQFNSQLVGNNLSAILLPPPNITGTLHLGHSLTVACQDAIARWKRMSGEEVVWVPGTDHAGIATQVVIEKMLAAAAASRGNPSQFSHKQFIEKIWAWKYQNENIIIQQIKKLGASVDWSKLFFTMDQAQSEAVTHAFVRLWSEGLIYQGDCLVNWCCSLGSAISHIEVDHISLTQPTDIKVPGYQHPVTFGNIIDFAYQFDDHSDGEIIVSTTRLETMIGDVGVCVHPQDSRYNHLIGKQLVHPFSKRKIKIIADTIVDPQFGTGAMKVTPAHDETDFELAKRHNLSWTTVIDEKGFMNENAAPFQGMKRFDARVETFKRLSELGLIRGVKAHQMEVPVCSRTGDVIELMPKPQWFLRCSLMAEKVSEVVRDGKLRIEPDHFEKDLFHWLDNIRDWCISRQLVWGHRLPLYKVEGGSEWVACDNQELLRETWPHPESGTNIERHPDVLDTWFSSALLPLTIAGWPTKLSNKLYPLNVMITGHDILFFWVARMAMFGLHFTGKVPFKKIFLHGIVCDSEGRKMSKSVGNVINPQHIINGISNKGLIEEIERNHKNGLLSSSERERSIKNINQNYPSGIPECGTDALRFTLLSHRLKNHYINFNGKECLTNKLLCNKIWQAGRFTLSRADKLSVSLDVCDTPKPQTEMDKWILLKLYKTVSCVNGSFESFDFHMATSKLKHFMYSDICDTYLESIKPLLNENDELAKESCRILLFCLVNGLQMLAPLMPFLAEKLFASLQPHVKSSIHLTSFPQPHKWMYGDEEDLENVVSNCIEVVNQIRSLKSSSKLQQNLEVGLVVKKTGLSDEMLSVIKTLSKCKIFVFSDLENHEDWVLKSIIKNDIKLFLKKEIISFDSKHCEKRRIKLEEGLNKLLKMRSHQSYRTKVPESVQNCHSAKISKICAELNIASPEIMACDDGTKDR